MTSRCSEHTLPVRCATNARDSRTRCTLAAWSCAWTATARGRATCTTSKTSDAPLARTTRRCCTSCTATPVANGTDAGARSGGVTQAPASTHSRPVYPYPGAPLLRRRIQCVSTSSSSFENRKSLPQPWCGLRGEELSTASGIPGGVFIRALQPPCLPLPRCLRRRDRGGEAGAD